MKKFYLLFASLLILSQSISFAQTEPPLINNWYEISNLDHLRWISETDSSWNNNFKLMNDINAADTKNWNDGAGFSPIGNYQPSRFQGDFNGNNYKIDSLYINRPNEDYIGFFGSTNTATIKNIGITNCDITGINYVGALTGHSVSAYISNSYITGVVTGVSSVGLFVGGNVSASIMNSYAIGSVWGFEITGGLVGRNHYSEIRNSYAKVNVSRIDESKTTFGGFCGTSNNGTISFCYSTGNVNCSDVTNKGFIGSDKQTSSYTNNFFDSETSNQITDAIGAASPKTTKEMQTLSTFKNSGWNFDFIWDITNSYPYINIDMTYRPKDFDNNGSLNIRTLTDLRWLSETGFDSDKEWEVDNDINASDTKNWNAGNGFFPIENFTGKFDGHYYIIDSLLIKFTHRTKVGFFGYAHNAIIKNIALTNCDVTGRTFVGGLVGINSSTVITQCLYTGTVRALGSYVGGLIGFNSKPDAGIIKSIVRNCYSHANVFYSGAGETGSGFCAYNSETIEYCYSVGNVYCGGDTNKGFVAADYEPTTYKSNFFDSEVSNQKTDSIGAATPKTTAEMKTKNTFTNADWDFINVWSIDPKINNGYPFFKASPLSVLENVSVKSNELLIYPNPITHGNTIIISYDKSISDFTILIYNIKGEKVTTLPTSTITQNKNSIHIPIQNLENGIYILVLQSKGDSISKKFVVRK